MMRCNAMVVPMDPPRPLCSLEDVGYKQGTRSTRVVYKEVGQLRSLDLRVSLLSLHPDPQRTLPSSSRVPVRWVVEQGSHLDTGTLLGREVPGSTSVS